MAQEATAGFDDLAISPGIDPDRKKGIIWIMQKVNG
jgi:hypothetical protein